MFSSLRMQLSQVYQAHSYHSTSASSAKLEKLNDLLAPQGADTGINILPRISSATDTVGDEDFNR